MNNEEPIAEVKKLRNGIRKHRDSTGHDLCWYPPSCEAFCRKRRTPSRLYRNGPSLWKAVCDIGSR